MLLFKIDSLFFAFDKWEYVGSIFTWLKVSEKVSQNDKYLKFWGNLISTGSN